MTSSAEGFQNAEGRLSLGQYALNLTGRVGSGRAKLKSRGSDRVGSGRIKRFKNLEGRVGSGQEA